MKRFGFAVLLAAASTFFAESSLGSSSVTQNPVWGLLVTLPLYGLHCLVLGRIAFSRGRPTFATLYLCGMLFGLYEAYITKVIWTGWDNHPYSVLGVSAMAFPLLVLWYHPFISFIVPLVFVERYAIGWHPGDQLMPTWITSRLDGSKGRIRTLIGLGAFMGFYHAGVVVGKPSITFFSALDAVWLLLVVLLWKRYAGTLQEMLPSGKGLALACVLLAALYLLGGLVLSPDKLPGLGGQATIWVVYAVVISALVRSLKTGRPPSDLPSFPPVPLMKDWPWLIGAWLFAAMIPRFVPGLAIIAFVLCSISGLFVGVWALIKTIRAVLFGHLQPSIP